MPYAEQLHDEVGDDVLSCAVPDDISVVFMNKPVRGETIAPLETLPRADAVAASAAANRLPGRAPAAS